MIFESDSSLQRLRYTAPVVVGDGFWIGSMIRSTGGMIFWAGSMFLRSVVDCENEMISEVIFADEIEREAFGHFADDNASFVCIIWAG